jgi:hypothetical protein
MERAGESLSVIKVGVVLLFFLRLKLLLFRFRRGLPDETEVGNVGEGVNPDSEVGNVGEGVNLERGIRRGVRKPPVTGGVDFAAGDDCTELLLVVRSV